MEIARLARELGLSEEQFLNMRLNVEETHTQLEKRMFKFSLPFALRAVWGNDIAIVPPDNSKMPYILSRFTVHFDSNVNRYICNFTNHPGALPLSGQHLIDLFGLALYRSVADAVLLSTNVLRLHSEIDWCAKGAVKYMPIENQGRLVGLFDEYRRSLGKEKHLVVVLVAPSGHIPDEAIAYMRRAVGVQIFIATTERGQDRFKSIWNKLPQNVATIVCGHRQLVFNELLRRLKNEHQLEHILFEGGNQTLVRLVKRGLVPELRLTNVISAPDIIGWQKEPRTYLFDGLEVDKTGLPLGLHLIERRMTRHHDVLLDLYDVKRNKR